MSPTLPGAREYRLYALVHEPSYAQGFATRWSAQRIRAEFAEFDAAAAIDGDPQTAPLLFTVEMIYPWMIASLPTAGRTQAALKITGVLPILFAGADRHPVVTGIPCCEGLLPRA